MSTEMVIFDCDGVLVDSEVISIEIEAAVLADAGFPVTKEMIADRYIGLSYADMMADIHNEFGRPVPRGLSELIQRRTLEEFPGRLQAVEGIRELLEDMDLPRCVASSSDLDRVELSLEVADLATFFKPDAIYSAQMVARGKPAPDLFLYAAESCGVSPQRCIVIEDSPYGVTAALAAGMDVVGFVGGRHARPSLRRRLAAAGARSIVTHPSELTLS